ncbi:MAG: polysaccharide deacetylase [Micrococcales bacterium 73-13]|mgnify:CR=1 FL=1|nr:MAG: polysaccharide deacetylase [Micrococcales bacterium 73-13]
MKNPPYRYWPITERPAIEWPDGKRFAFYVGLNIEHFHPGSPSTSVVPLTAHLPVDPLNYGWRDYSTRVGIWRMIELLDRHDLRASVLLNSEVCREYPQIVQAGVERDWAWLGHGRTNSALWTGMDEAAERAGLAEITEAITAATGKQPRGWLGPALTETENTPELLAELGYTYTCDWVADDQPFPLTLDSGARMISVPYSIEVNDIPAFLDHGLSAPAFGQMIVDHFELLHEESQRRPGAVFGVSLHPFLINQPSRHRYLAEALERIGGRDDVWYTTSDDIADWYLQHHYDTAVRAMNADS